MIGSERTSAFLKSSSNAFEIALSALASPNCPTNTSGFAFWAAADGGDRAVDALLGDVVVTGDLERDQRRAAVLGELAVVALGERRLDLVDALEAFQAPDGVFDCGGERRITDLDGALALDEHLLVGGVAEVRGGDGLVGRL